MDLVQQGTSTRETRGWANALGPALLIAVVIVAVVSAAILEGSLVAGAPARNGVGSQVDPLAQPNLVEFRRSEHAVAVGP
jgi:hypothetical protein